MEDYRLEQSGQEVQDILNGVAMQTDLTAENERAELAEQTLQGNIDAEALARENADGVLQGHIDDEETRAKAAEKQNADDIDAIEEKIPTQASSSNQLADKDYVEDLVSTSSATFRGTFNLVSDLHLTVDASYADIAAALGNAIAGADNNDFAFVMIPTSVDTPNEIARIEKYKFNGSVWGFEYVLNNSGFTAAQWAAINSGITSALVTKLGALPSAADLAAALLAKQDKLNFDQAPTPSSTNPVTSGGVYTAIDDEKGARVNADAALQQAIEAILLLIPSAATALNQLADKAFVNSSIATATATFRGTFNLVSDLQLTVDATHADIAAALLNAISGADNNDYAFVQIPTSVDTPTEIRVTERYKFNGTAWSYEYDLNNSGFTASQWAAINSGITALLVTKLSNLPNATELATMFAGKQNTLTFDNAPVSGSDNPVKSGGLYNLFAAIDAKMPTGASANNKLVAEDRLAAYVSGIINALDATFDLTSTDGHVTLRLTQTDGVIASMQILTSDIASASALTTLGGQVSTNADDIVALQALYNALQQSAPEVIQPSDTWPVDNPSDTVIYRVIDRVNTSPQYYSDYMWNGTSMVLMATYNNAIDPRPKKGSANLVTSGGVFDNWKKHEDWIKGKTFVTLSQEGQDVTRAYIIIDNSVQPIYKVHVSTGYRFIVNSKYAESDSWTTITPGGWNTEDFDLSSFNYDYYEIRVRNDDDTAISHDYYDSIVEVYLYNSFSEETKEIIQSEVGDDVDAIRQIEEWKKTYQYLTDYVLVDSNTRAWFDIDYLPQSLKIKDGYQFAMQGRNSDADEWVYVQGNFYLGVGEYIFPANTQKFNHYRVVVRKTSETSIAGDDLSDVVRVRFTDSFLNSVLNIDSPVYVAPDGNDDSGDGTISKPLKSIQIAINTGRPVVLKNGLYFVNSELDLSLVDRFVMKADVSANPVLMLGAIISTEEGELYTGSSKVYSLNVGTDFNYSSLNWIYQYGVDDVNTEILAADRTAYHGRKTYRCDFSAIKQVGSIESIENADYPTFYYNSGVLYYSRPENISSNKFLFMPTNNLFVSTAKKSIEMTAIRIYGATVNIINAFPSALMNCSVYACKSGAGFLIENSVGVTLRNCEAARVESGYGYLTGDGFNMHTLGTISENGKYTSFVMENCWSHDNWNDGYSDHEGCEGYINGGLFEFNCIGGAGGGLTPAYGAHDVIFNAICQKNGMAGLKYTSTGGIHELASITVNGVVSRNNATGGFEISESVDYADFINCIAYGNNYGFYAGQNSHARCINCKSVDNTVEQFSPNIEII